MDNKDIPTTHLNPWHPMTNPIDLKHLGKLGEEAGELGSAVSRCIIQGINEQDPTSTKTNKEWLEDEIADVWANSNLVINRFLLDVDRIKSRAAKKQAALIKWHDMA